MESEPLHNFDQVDITNGSSHRHRRASGNWKFYLLAGLLFSGILTLILVFLLLMEPNIGTYNPPTDGNETVGILLQTAIPLKEHRGHVEKKKTNFVLHSDVVTSCMKHGRDELKGRRAMEEKMAKMNRTVPKNTPISYHQQVTALNPEFVSVLDGAVVAEASVRNLLQRNISLETLQSADMDALLREWPHCKSTTIPQCSPTARFRTLGGECNNLKSPDWGASLQPFRRVSPPAYDDEFSGPRTTSLVDKQRLPSARSVSLAFQNATTMVYETRLSMLFLTWGQFVDHDMTTTAPNKGADGSSISCCGDTDILHPECFPILIEANDQFYNDKGVSCLDFVRSAPAPQCAIGEREQMNQNTAYIDASMVYGTTHLEANVKLRVHERGYVRSRLNEDGRWMLAISPDANDGCNRPEFMTKNRFCFKSGDARTNEQIALTSFHTIFVREHNRIASELVDLNPHWDDNRVYEETRRIVGAMIQHVTYNEFVPLLLGKTLANHLDLRPLLSGYTTTYDQTVNAGISNEFAAAAFRFGHSMLQGLVIFEGARGRNVDYIQLHKTMFYPFALWDFGKMDAVIRGEAGQNPRTVHTSFSAQTTNHLFQPINSTYGLDLFAVNIQRGRDHGLATYAQWRQMCNLDPVVEWSQLEPLMRPVSLQIMKNIYRNVLDVDLYVGILAELPISDGILGPVGTCIIADQFVRLKRGDRFWYETSDPLLRFTPEQLAEIRKVTLARLLCDNGDAMDLMQPLAMESVSADNPRRHCSDKSIPRYDISPWEEDDSSDSLLP